MSIIFVNRYAWPDHSATSQLLTDLVRSLAAAGHRVTVIASRQRYDDPFANLLKRETMDGVRYVRIHTTRFGRARLLGRALDYLSFYIKLPITLWREIRGGDVVVAKTDPPLLGMVVAPIAWMRGAKTVNWLQDLFPEVSIALGQPWIPWPLTTLLCWARDLGLRSAAMNVAIGTRMAERLRARRLASNALCVIPNWAHESVVRPQSRVGNSFRRQLGLDDQFVVAYSGNLGRAHDAETLYDAARRLAGRTDVAFLMIGDGYRMRALRERASREGRSNMHFLPYQPIERLSEALAAGDLHLVSLRPELEGLIVPSKFYGIAAAARPIGFIGDIDGELARLISTHACGFSVAQGDDEALALAIAGMAAAPDRGAACGQRARHLLLTTFSRDAAHRQWHDLLSQLGAAAPATTEEPST